MKTYVASLLMFLVGPLLVLAITPFHRQAEWRMSFSPDCLVENAEACNETCVPLAACTETAALIMGVDELRGFRDWVAGNFGASAAEENGKQVFDYVEHYGRRQVIQIDISVEEAVENFDRTRRPIVISDFGGKDTPYGYEAYACTVVVDKFNGDYVLYDPVWGQFYFRSRASLVAHATGKERDSWGLVLHVTKRVASQR